MVSPSYPSLPIVVTSLLLNLSGLIGHPQSCIASNDLYETAEFRMQEQLISVGGEEATQVALPQFRAASSASGSSRFWYALLGCVVVFGILVLAGLHRRQIKLMKKELAIVQEKSRVNGEMRDILQERVNRLQRMESLGMLAGGVAHDFNNLLVGVMGNAEILGLNREELSGFAQERVQQILVAAQKAADLSRQMLAYAGKQQIMRKALNLNDLAGNMLRVLSATAGEKIQLSVVPTNEPLVTEVDETQIEQILLNLVSNAKSASDDGSRIIVRTGFESIADVAGDPNLHGTRDEPGEFVFIEVEDFGRGFGAVQMDRIFEPFYSIKEQGRGLGLSVVYGIVNGHHGLIRVTSTPGLGTRFRILLPRSSTPATPASANIADAADSPSSSAVMKSLGRILVADDEATVCQLAVSLLKSEGYSVDTVRDGNEAMQLLRKDPGKYSFLLLDVVMPNMGAKDFLKACEVAGIRLPIILMSGFSDAKLEEFRSHDSIVAILAKPFQVADFSNAVAVAMSTRFGPLFPKISGNA